MKKIYLLLALLLFSVTFVSAETGLTDCGLLDVEGETYVLEKDVSSFGTCFAVMANDVTVDCNGHRITYSEEVGGNGIIIQGYDRLYVKNCNIVQGSASSNSDAVRFHNSDGGAVVGNIMETIGPFSLGVWVERSSDNSIINNAIFTEGAASSGAAAYLSSDENVFFSNEIKTNNQIGIGVFGGEGNKVIKNDLSGNEIDVYVRDGSVGEYDLVDSTLVVEDPNYGLLKYYDSINANDDDLSDRVEIHFNLISIEEADPGLDDSAELTIYHTDLLGLDDRKALRYDKLCPFEICEEIVDADSYNFNVTGFGDYSVGDVNGSVNVTDPNDDDDEDDEDDEDGNSSCSGWNCLKSGNEWDHTDFFITGREDPTNWELAIKDPDYAKVNLGNPEIAVAQDDYSFDNGGEASPFNVRYNPIDGMVTYNLDGKIISWKYGENKAFEYVVIMAKGAHKGEDKCDVVLTNLKINGNSIGNLASEGNYQGYRINLTDAEQQDGFEVSGLATLSWGSNCKKQEIPGFHVYAMNTHELENDNGSPDETVVLSLTPCVIVPVEDYDVEFSILGSALSRGISWDRYITVQFNLGDEILEPWGDYSTPVESNVNDGNYPKAFSPEGLNSAGTSISFSARSWNKRKFYQFGNKNEHWAIFNEVDTSVDSLPTRMLKDGDDLPSHKGFKDQVDVSDFLEPYVENGRISLDDNQVICMVELGEANFHSKAADWQDLVVLFTIKGDGEIVESSVKSLPGITGFSIKDMDKRDVKAVLALVVLAIVLFSITVMRRKYS